MLDIKLANYNLKNSWMLDIKLANDNWFSSPTKLYVATLKHELQVKPSHMK